MQIKPQTVIPPNVKITKIPPSEGKARSVHSLAREAEKKIEQEQAAKLKAERFKEARERGMSVQEAIDYALK